MAKDTKKSKKEKTRKDNSKGFFKEFRAELKKVVCQHLNNLLIIQALLSV